MSTTCRCRARASACQSSISPETKSVSSSLMATRSTGGVCHRSPPPFKASPGDATCDEATRPSRAAVPGGRGLECRPSHDQPRQRVGRGMTPGPGSRLGPYEITGAIGAGGMGEVYRARGHEARARRRDQGAACARLRRTPSASPASGARPSCSRRSITRTSPPSTASRKRTAILALVLELVEGEDLAERLKRGPIPVDEAIAIAKLIAEALEEAHEKGIVHRDLKPANVKLTPDGKVKVLDFGLAKAWSGEEPGAASSADFSRLPDACPHRNRGRPDPRHRRLHVARAGAGKGRRPARGHLGLRRRPLRDADRPPALRRRDRDGRARGGGAPGDRLGSPPGGDARERATTAPALSRPRPAPAPARYRRGQGRAGRAGRGGARGRESRGIGRPGAVRARSGRASPSAACWPESPRERSSPRAGARLPRRRPIGRLGRSSWRRRVEGSSTRRRSRRMDASSPTRLRARS